MSSLPPKKQIGLSLENVVFYVSLAALAVTAGTFFYLQNMISKSENELDSLTIEAAKGKTQDQKNLENSILTTQQELRDFSKLVADRKAGSQVFTKLEDVMVFGAHLSQCDIDITNMTGVIAGQAKDFKVLGQQVAELQSADDVLSEVTVGQVNINEDDGSIEFQLKVKFNDAVAVPQYGG